MMTLPIGKKESGAELLPLLKSRRGFTLVELLVTVVIITSGAMFLLPGLGVASKIAQVAEGQAQAYLFSVNTLTEFGLKASESASVKDFPGNDEGAFDPRRRDAHWFAQTGPFLEDPRLQKMQFDFTWPGRANGEHFQLLTVFFFDALE